jgi:hypothetical protein
VFKIEAEDLKKFMAGESVEARGRDSVGVLWAVALRPAKNEDAFEAKIEFEEMPTWAILIGGHVIGYENHEKPEEAVREAFASAGLTSLPEAVEVVARRDDTGESWVIFTMGGAAYCIPHAQFVAEVMKSDQWTGTQRTKRAEIDALMAEIKALPGNVR